MADRADLAAIKARLEHVERPASVFAHAVPQAMYAADVAALIAECARLRDEVREAWAHEGLTHMDFGRETDALREQLDDARRELLHVGYDRDKYLGECRALNRALDLRPTAVGVNAWMAEGLRQCIELRAALACEREAADDLAADRDALRARVAALEAALRTINGYACDCDTDERVACTAIAVVCDEALAAGAREEASDGE